MSIYSKIEPIAAAISADRQGARRHYGVHPYFTRRPYNVVREYITHYSKEGDCVLDPFGGSGVTAIEAFLENRVGIHNDINPLANFIARGIANLQNGSLSAYLEGLRFLQSKCEEPLQRVGTLEPKKLAQFRKKVCLPPNIDLPRSADVPKYHDLFTEVQLISLAYLKDQIDLIRDRHVRQAMVLAWSATLTKLNKTFLSAEGRAESRGGSSIFSIYRMKIAKKVVELPAWDTFHERALNVIEAKKEIDYQINLKKRTGGWFGSFELRARDIEELEEEYRNSIDYIFTDPPYGGNISYLDLSLLWTNWLGINPSVDIRKQELIVGGELGISDSTYTERLHKSIKCCMVMLKKDRWLSVVFQHWNIAYFEAILSSAADSGAELKAAISQVGDPIWSMHKKKNSSVLAGEMILTFQKTGKALTPKSGGKFDLEEYVARALEDKEGQPVYGEYLFNRIVIEAWNKAAIGSLGISKNEFMGLLEHLGWHYDQSNHWWIKENVGSGLLPF